MEEILKKCSEAIARRSNLSNDPDTDAFRLIHSEADGFPGLTVDRLGDVLLVEQHREDADAQPLIQAVSTIVGPEVPVFFKARWSPLSEDRAGRQVCGNAHPGALVATERGLRFSLRLRDEEHIGIFLDARHPREIVRRISPGRRVLNLFSYTGGFGMAAAAGGAISTVNIDSKQSAGDIARRNYGLNGLPFDDRTFFKCDVLYYLKRAAAGRGRFDLIVLDPPPRFKRRHQRDFQMDRDYGKLLAACFPVAAPGALVMAGLNASRVSDDRFEEMIAAETAAISGNIQCKIIDRIQPADDFPPASDRPAARFILLSLNS